ncbi:hypothetical protein GCM10010329_84100 [Streptomyces spiroverticillatus]|uniref:Tetratricopeptide repeat protein n=1 Tax=Streptomyces finlayi TaxID=67296 RepID=A0A919CFT7_9ACTN|nr:tetratricopeptide repeat protein [Streptomyces finlayi]GHA48965.1 hypothetical protein GCM10010329_84100 [Streptomyces spiroverticillatus]GHD19258.1 hypothetical protein GCM10010334_82750 [Streptomyces finlayi]
MTTSAAGNEDDRPLYERAGDLHRRGRPEEALVLLQEHLQQHPGDLAARYALGICLTDTARHAEARVQFRRTLDDDPRHYQAAYRLGRLLEADADPAGAADAYRQVLAAVAEFRDTATRLRTCAEAAGDAVRPGMPGLPPMPPSLPGGPVLTGRTLVPGPPTLRSQSEAHRVADRGIEKYAVRLRPRHLAPALLGKAALATAAAVLASHVLGTGQIEVGAARSRGRG